MSTLSDLIGRIIQNCGAIELVVNQTIKGLATDSILATKAVRSGLHKRVDLMKDLLLERRKELTIEFVNDLTSSIKKLANERNIVAHNPLMAKTKSESNLKLCFFVVENGKEVLKEYDSKKLTFILKLSQDVIKKLKQLLPVKL